MTRRHFGQLVTDAELNRLTRQLVIQERMLLKAEGAVSQEAVAEYYGLTVKKAPLGPDQDGALSGRQIILNSRIVSVERLNFTFYHEVTHYLIERSDDLIDKIHNACKSPNDTLERQCDVGAAEFLIPSDEINRFTQEHGFQTIAIPVFCKQFEASGIAVAIQMTICAHHHCYLVIAEPRLRLSEKNQANLDGMVTDREGWYLGISYTARSSAAKYVIARHTPIPGNHLIATAYRDQCRITGSANIPFRTATIMPADCDVLYFQGKAYAFFNVTQPHSPHQLPLLRPADR